MLLAHDTTDPTVQDRRDAVCRSMMAAPGLIRFAARFTRSIEDAEDAYQRAMEIALLRAPVTEHAAFTAWLHTVIRREAQQITEDRLREQPVRAAELEEALDAASGAPAPDAVLEWRERYHAVQDAILGLAEPERVCLMLRSAGASHAEIQALTGYSERKVRRSILEGRTRLNAWEIRMRSGKECAPVPDLIDRVLDDSATGRERRALSRHIRHCNACRMSYRRRREQTLVLGSLVPVALVGAGSASAAAPDPGLVLTWWERVTASAGVKASQAMQLVADAPAAIASTRAGAGAVAVVAAGAIGAPIVLNGHGDRAVRAASPIVAAAVAQPHVASPPRAATLPGVSRPARQAAATPHRRAATPAPPPAAVAQTVSPASATPSRLPWAGSPDREFSP